MTCVGAGTAAPAAAQIYTWRDANGTLVLSNLRQQPAATTYAVPRASAIRSTQPAAAGTNEMYDDLIVAHARRFGVRADLVRAVVQVESAYNPYARSPKGALGLMQLMPATIQDFGVRNPFDPGENIRAGVAYLRRLLDRYQDSEELALAAYNAGPAAVDRYSSSVPPYRETQNYVSRINEMAGHAAPAPAPAARPIYKTTETIDGRPVVRYSDRKPATGTYEIVGR